MKSWIALLVVSSLVSTQATASVRDAAFASSSDWPGAQASMFAAATYRVPLTGKSGERRATASLRISGMMMRSGAPAQFGGGLELARGRTGKPALHIAGHDIGKLDRTSNLSTGAKIAIGVGVLVLAVVAVGAATDWGRCREENGDTCD